MAARHKSSGSKLPMLNNNKEKKISPNVRQSLVDNSSPPRTSLPSLPSSPLVGDTQHLLSRTSSKRSRLKAQLSTTSRAIDASMIGDERRTSSEPSNRPSTFRHPSGVSTMLLENGSSDSSDLGHSISIGGKMVPTYIGSNSPSPSMPPAQQRTQTRASRPRSNSVATRPNLASSDQSVRKSRNSGSSSELASRKDGIYERQSLGDDAKRKSAHSGAVSASSPPWAGQLTDAVLELSQEINRLRSIPAGAVVTVSEQQPASQNSSTKPKSTSIFWNQAALRNASLRT